MYIFMDQGCGNKDDLLYWSYDIFTKSTNSLSINDEGKKRSNEGDRERIIYHFVQNTKKKGLLKTYLHMTMMDTTTTTRSITTRTYERMYPYALMTDSENRPSGTLDPPIE